MISQKIGSKQYNDIDFKAVLNPNRLILLLTIGSILSLGILLIIGIPSEYNMLYVEPIVYIICLRLFVRAKNLVGVGGLALVSMYFIKLCIVPITTTLGNFTTIVSTSIFSYYWDEGCFYIAMEWFIVSAAIKIISSKCNLLSNCMEYLDYRGKNDLSIKKHPIFYSAMFGLIGICLFLTLINRSLLSSFFFLWEMEDGTAASAGGPTWFMFKVFVEWVKPMFFFWLTLKIFASRISFLKISLLLLVTIFSSILMTEYRILSLLTGITILSYILSKYHNYKFLGNAIKMVGVFGGIYCVYILTTHGEAISQSLANLGRLLDIYCGGYIVAAASCSVQLENGIFYFIQDTLSGSFLLRNLFGPFDTTTDAINMALNSGAKGTFYEMMVQCKDFFGILAPIAIGLCVYFILKMDINAKYEKIEMYRMFYVFCGISTAFFMVMYTFSMITNFILWKCFL